MTAKKIDKRALVSGIKPTGDMHLGNLFGLVKPFVELQNQDKYRCFFMIADLHALTTLDNTEEIKKNTLSITAWALASGIRPKETTIFVQSMIPEVTEIAYILGTFAPLGELESNPVYKEMKQKFRNKNTLGLLGYPVLQAADILAYKAEAVPVGKDQSKHIEIAREIARRFNNIYGLTFPWPKELFAQYPKISSLQDPAKKMAKSDSTHDYIALSDDKKTVEEKIKKAVTDSGQGVTFDQEKKPALANLIALYQLASGLEIKEIEKKFEDASYAEFKEELAWKMSTSLAPMQTHYKNLMGNKRKLFDILKSGTEEARSVAQKTLIEMKKKIGLLQ